MSVVIGFNCAVAGIEPVVGIFIAIFQVAIFINLEKIIFPKSMIFFSEYIDTIQKKKLYEPYYETKGKYNSNQILDFHTDWITENNCLFVLEEFQKMENNWKLEILRILINSIEINHKTATKVILTVEEEADLINDLKEIVNPTNKKTKEQVLKSNLTIINI